MSYEYNPIPSLNQWVTSSPANPTRAEIARDILCAMVAQGRSIGAPARAVRLADELLAELGRGKAGKDETPAQSRLGELRRTFGGQAVYIDWTGPGDDWHWFIVIGVEEAGDGEYRITLTGTDAPDGTRYDGDTFTVLLSEIKNMRLRKNSKPDPVVEELVEAGTDMAWKLSGMPGGYVELARAWNIALKAYREAHR